MPTLELAIPNLDQNQTDQTEYVRAFTATVKSYLEDSSLQPLLPEFASIFLERVNQEQVTFADLVALFNPDGELCRGYAAYFSEGQFANIDTIWNNINGASSQERDNSMAELSGLLETEDGQNRWNLYQTFKNMQSELKSVNKFYTSAREQRIEAAGINEAYGQRENAYKEKYEKFSPDYRIDYLNPNKSEDSLKSINLASDILKLGNYEALVKEQKDIESLLESCEKQLNNYRDRESELRELGSIGESKDYLKNAVIGLKRLEAEEAERIKDYEKAQAAYLKAKEEADNAKNELNQLELDIQTTKADCKALQTKYKNGVGANKKGLQDKLKAMRDDINSGRKIGSDEQAYGYSNQQNQFDIMIETRKSAEDSKWKLLEEKGDEEYKKGLVDEWLQYYTDPDNGARKERKPDFLDECNGFIEKNLKELRDKHVKALNRKLEEYQTEAANSYNSKQSAADAEMRILDEQINAAKQKYDTQIKAKQEDLNAKIRGNSDLLLELAEKDEGALAELQKEKKRLNEVNDTEKTSKTVSDKIKEYEERLFNKDNVKQDDPIKKWATNQDGFKTGDWSVRLENQMRLRVESSGAYEAAAAVLTKLADLEPLLNEKDLNGTLIGRKKEDLRRQYILNHSDEYRNNKEQVQKNFERVYEGYQTIGYNFKMAFDLYTPIDEDEIKKKGIDKLKVFPTKERDEQEKTNKSSIYKYSVQRIIEKAKDYQQNAQRLMDGPRLTALKAEPEKNRERIQQWENAFKPLDTELNQYYANKKLIDSIEALEESRRSRINELEEILEDNNNTRNRYEYDNATWKDQLKKLNESEEKRDLEKQIRDLEQQKLKLQTEKTNRANSWEEKEYTSFLAPNAEEDYHKVEGDIKKWDSDRPEFIQGLMESSEDATEKDICRKIVKSWKELDTYQKEKEKYEKIADDTVAEIKRRHGSILEDIKKEKDRAASLIKEQKKDDLETIEKMLALLEKAPDGISSKDIEAIEKLSTRKIEWETYRGIRNEPLEGLLKECKAVLASQDKKDLEAKSAVLPQMEANQQERSKSSLELNRKAIYCENYVHTLTKGEEASIDRKNITKVIELMQFGESIEGSMKLLEKEKEGFTNIAKQVRELREANNAWVEANRQSGEFKAGLNQGVMSSVIGQIKSGMDFFIKTADVAKKPSHSNTNEYRHMFDAVKALVDQENMTADTLEDMLKMVKSNAKTYLAIKHSWDKWIPRPSKQRIARLNYATRLVAFCENSLKKLEWADTASATEAQNIHIRTTDGRISYDTDKKFFDEYIVPKVIEKRDDIDKIREWGIPEEKQKLETKAYRDYTSFHDENARKLRAAYTDGKTKITELTGSIKDLKYALGNAYKPKKNEKNEPMRKKEKEAIGDANEIITLIGNGEEPKGVSKDVFDSYKETVRKINGLNDKLEKEKKEFNETGNKLLDNECRFQAESNYQLEQDRNKKYSFSNPEMSEQKMWREDLKQNLEKYKEDFKENGTFSWEKAGDSIRNRSKDVKDAEKKAANKLKNPFEKFVKTRTITQQEEAKKTEIDEAKNKLKTEWIEKLRKGQTEKLKTGWDVQMMNEWDEKLQNAPKQKESKNINAPQDNNMQKPKDVPKANPGLIVL